MFWTWNPLEQKGDTFLNACICMKKKFGEKVEKGKKSKVLYFFYFYWVQKCGAQRNKK